MTVDLILDSI